MPVLTDRDAPLEAVDVSDEQMTKVRPVVHPPRVGANRTFSMIDRFLTGVSNAHGFLAKLWVLSRPYWFSQDYSTIRLANLTFTVREAWIARCVLALIIALSIAIVYLSKL